MTVLKKKIKILLTNFHPNEGGGHDTYIRSLRKLESDTVSITVVAPQTSSLYQSLASEKCNNIIVCDFPAKLQKEPLSVIASINNFRRIVHDLQPDIVHANGGADLFIDIWSHPFDRSYKIVRSHHAVKTIRNDPYHNWIYKRCTSANIYVSQAAMIFAQSRGISPVNSVVIQNGVDLYQYSPQPLNNQLRASMGISPDIICFGSNAGLSHYKRVDIMIKAASLLRGDLDRFHIVVAGNPQRGKELEMLAKEYGVTNFKYAGTYKDVRSFISMIDVGFVLSDSIETASYASREMLSMGKPLISSSYSGLVENVIDGFDGFLVSPGNVDETARAMKTFLDMPKTKLLEFSRNARRLAEDKFGLITQLDRHLEVYKSLLSKSNWGQS